MMKNNILENFENIKNIVYSVCKQTLFTEQIKTTFLFQLLSSKKCCYI